ncbi:TonB-dependent siderophore receptor [Stutzerimonas xanthomarina]|uniref:Iron complex outermembrane recepter protein n=2 Tax=Stutzerimonas xanthomarina TaxID=271420 RepID=A0A1M5LEV4_9GAMM|nr:TonB-dependent siderophore receptor [Stutzerimonas xanthomarina]MCP9340510.1 TonB-dependent siderophore receptor [Stutzerimonas xanthomarina]SEH53056.1 iron complex outermembrane recepter protein [Stutzerimonas xanthomarina]SHG63591.1 iron complex outermembrane recepter protein [Stutzerimonas xanthomarina DSM 18231]
MRSTALPVCRPRSLSQAIRAAMLCLPLATVGVAPMALAQSIEQQTERTYDIPAGSLSTALSRFAGEAGVMLSVDGRLVDNRQSSGLHGQYGVAEGFDTLLRGSGLRAVRDQRGAYLLVPAPSGEQAEAVELKPMVVEGFALGNALGAMEGYNATHSSVATKTSMPLAETSQTVSVVTRQQIEDQGSRSIAQAVRYTPGLMSSPYGATTRYDYVAMRGITDGAVDNLYLDGQKLLGDSGTYSSLQVDPYFIERIDILKGPSSVLYGRSLPGGLVAMTSKKPQYETRRQIRLSYGSEDNKQAAFDFTGPLDDERIAYRLVGVARDADNQVDGIEEQRYAVMPSLSIDFSEDTRLTLQAMLQHDPESGYHGGLPADGTVTSHNGQRISRSFFEGDEDYEKFERDQQMIGYQLEHRFNDTVSARQNFQYLDSTVESGQVYQYGYATQDELVRYYTGADEVLHAWTLDNQLQFLFDTGALSHTLVTGLDYQRRKAKVDYSAATGVGTTNPYSGAANPSSFAFYHQYDELRELEQTGLYVQDLISLGKWRFSLGARQDWVDVSFEQTESMYGDQADQSKLEQFTGRVGVLYAFDNGLSPYASYSESFNPNATGAYNYDSGTGAYDITLLDPTEGEQYELGLKYQPLGTDDLYTISYFDLKQSNLANKDSNESFYRAVGELTSKGVEVEARLRPHDNLNVIASYTYMDVEYSRDFTGAAGVNNRGNTPNAVARNMASLWTDYRFEQGSLAGLQVGGGVRYFGKSWADAENMLRIPSYTLYDAMLGYDLSRVGLDGLSAQLNLNNLTDEKYVAACNSLNQCYYGEARNVMATLTYDF